MLIPTAVIVCLSVSASALPAWSQTQPSSPPQVVAANSTPTAAGGHRLTFEVASVRPSSLSLGIKGGDFLQAASNAAPPPGGLFSWNVPFTWLINFAYDLRSPYLSVQAQSGLPKSMQSFQNSFFAVEARAEGIPTRDDVRQMVRSLLQDRFQYSAHLEKRTDRSMRSRWKSMALASSRTPRARPAP